jgi:heme-degrading monooxygenase HmoA
LNFILGNFSEKRQSKAAHFGRPFLWEPHIFVWENVMDIKQGCYAVIFTSQLGSDHEGYDAMAARMIALSAEQAGFLGVKSVRDGREGITVSYWQSEADIEAWKQNAEHLLAQEEGRGRFYENYQLQVCRVGRSYDFSAG